MDTLSLVATARPTASKKTRGWISRGSRPRPGPSPSCRTAACVALRACHDAIAPRRSRVQSRGAAATGRPTARAAPKASRATRRAAASPRADARAPPAPRSREPRPPFRFCCSRAHRRPGRSDLASFSGGACRRPEARLDRGRPSSARADVPEANLRRARLFLPSVRAGEAPGPALPLSSARAETRPACASRLSPPSARAAHAPPRAATRPDCGTGRPASAQQR